MICCESANTTKLWIRLVSLALQSHLPFIAMLNVRSSQLVKKCALCNLSNSRSSHLKALIPTSSLPTVDEDNSNCKGFRPCPSANGRVDEQESSEIQEGSIENGLREILLVQMQLDAILSDSSRVEKVQESGSNAEDQGGSRGEGIAEPKKEAPDLEMVRKTFDQIIQHMDLMREIDAREKEEEGAQHSSGEDTHESRSKRQGLQRNSFMAYRNVFVAVVSELLKRAQMQDETLRVLRAENSTEAGHAYGASHR